MQSTRRWINQSQPQTLVFATWLLYLTGAFTLLFFNDRIFYTAGFCGVNAASGFGGGGCSSLTNLLRLVLPAACVAGGYFVSNERRWGYYLAVVAASVPVAARFVFSVRYQVSPLNFDVIGLAFDVALVALLLHTMSREYQKIWFK